MSASTGLAGGTSDLRDIPYSTSSHESLLSVVLASNLKKLWARPSWHLLYHPAPAGWCSRCVLSTTWTTSDSTPCPRGQTPWRRPSSWKPSSSPAPASTSPPSKRAWATSRSTPAACSCSCWAAPGGAATRRRRRLVPWAVLLMVLQQYPQCRRWTRWSWPTWATSSSRRRRGSGTSASRQVRGGTPGRWVGTEALAPVWLQPAGLAGWHICV